MVAQKGRKLHPLEPGKIVTRKDRHFAELKSDLRRFAYFLPWINF